MFQALFTASRLGVFDLLQSRPELDAAQVAQEMKASVKGTQCLLDACVSLGLLNSRESCQSSLLIFVWLSLDVPDRCWFFVLSSPSVPKTGLPECSFNPTLPAVWGSPLPGGLHPALWPNRVASLHTPGVCCEGRNPPAWEGFWQESKRPLSGGTNYQREWKKSAFESLLMQFGVFGFLRTLSTTIKTWSLDSWVPCIVLQKSQDRLWQQPSISHASKQPATLEVRRDLALASTNVPVYWTVLFHTVCLNRVYWRLGPRTD